MYTHNVHRSVDIHTHDRASHLYLLTNIKYKKAKRHILNELVYVVCAATSGSTLRTLKHFALVQKEIHKDE